MFGYLGKCVFVRTNIIGEKSHQNCVGCALKDTKIQDVKFTEEQMVESLLKSVSGILLPGAGWSRGLDSVWRLAQEAGPGRGDAHRSGHPPAGEPQRPLGCRQRRLDPGLHEESTKTVDFTSQSEGTLNSCGTHIAGIRR